ncbi:hypothetical protein XELAEV_18002857mg [Xenopus laevis]|nr:hypothetical protein XELAEV_18002857mg [Xenopus laevis]
MVSQDRHSPCPSRRNFCTESPLGLCTDSTTSWTPWRRRTGRSLVSSANDKAKSSCSESLAPVVCVEY